MDYGSAQERSEILQGRTSYVLVKTAPGADVAAVAAEIRRRLPFNDVHTRDQWARKSRAYWVVSTGLGMNMGVTVFLGILVGIVVVAQTLYTSAVEHVKEFGTVKAIGGSNWDIYKILGEQALIAAVVGFVLGGLMSLAMRPLMARLYLNVLISPIFATTVFVGTILMCLGAAMLSFRRGPALENVEYALGVKGGKGQAALQEATRVLERVGLSDRLHFLPRDLSGGQKQRVAIARALAGSPRVILADEPTANLDTAAGVQILQLFRDLAKGEGTGLVIVTHDPKVRSGAARVVGIRAGRRAA